MQCLRASTHQANPIYRAAGKQCVANSLTAMTYAMKLHPKRWSTQDMDNILKQGDQLYQQIMPCISENQYLLVEELLKCVQNASIKVINKASGTILRIISESPFMCLRDAVNTLENYSFLTVGCYTMAVLRYGKVFYVFDSHSRNDFGLSAPENGTAVLTQHQGVEAFCTFLDNLCSSLFQNRDEPFELTSIELQEDQNFESSSGSDFSGFSEVEILCEKQTSSDSDENVPLSVLRNKFATCEELSDSEYFSSGSEYFSSGSEYKFTRFERKIIDGNVSESDFSSPDEMLCKAKKGRKKLFKLNKSKKMHKEKYGLGKMHQTVGEKGESVENGMNGKQMREKRVGGEHVGGTRDGDPSGERVGESASGERVSESASGERVSESASGERVSESASGEHVSESASGERVSESASGERVSESASGERVSESASGERVSESASGEHVSESASGESASGERVSESASGESASGERVSESASGEHVGESASGESVSANGERVAQNGCGEHVGENTGGEHVADKRGGEHEGENSDSVEHDSVGQNRGVLDEQMEEHRMDDMQNVRGRKRLRNEKSWKQNIRKRRKDLGMEYVSKRGKLCRARMIGAGCGLKCRHKCNEKITNEQRAEIFHSFWSLGNLELQRQFLFSHAKSEKKKTALNKENSKRANSVKWTLPVSNEKIQVCKTFFLHTLDISDQMVITANRKALSTSIGICSPDQRGKHKYRSHSISLHKKQFVREHIMSFPTVDSHYCRKDSKKQYLSSDLSVAKMYRLYVEKCQSTGQSPVKLSFYRKVFCEDFNISFHKPLKDLCDTCTAYKNQDVSVRCQMEEKYQLHLKNKEAARENKKNDKDMAKFIDDELCVACFDLQEILATPKSFESVLYYKRKLNTFDFSLYDLGSSKAYCYVWNETIAKRGASDISSCIFDFLKTMSDQGKKKFIFYSDNCSAQNKNRYYISMLWYCIQLFNLESVEHKYLEKGHTMNEGDSVHATIEHASRNISVYTTGQWAAVIRTARPARPYTVKEMSQNSFFDFAKVSKCLKNFDLDFNKDKVYFSEIKTFRISSNDPNTVYFRYNYGEPEQQIDLSQRLRRSGTVDPNDITLSRLYDRPLPLTVEKYNDLISLCRGGIIPRVYHPVYLLLPHESE